MSCEVFNNSDFGMIGGCQQTFDVDLYDVLNEEYHIAASSCEWRLAKYGETEVLATESTVKGTINITDNIIQITIPYSDTQNLFGKFTHQLVITDKLGNQFVADLGKISIKPMIK